MDTFGKLNEIYDILTSKDKDVLNDDNVIKLRELLNDDMIKLLKSIQTTFKSLNILKDKDTIELHEMIQRKIDPQSNEDTIISATAHSAATIMNNFGLGAVEKAHLLKKYINALDIINRSVAIDHLSPEAALNKAVNETGLSKETLKVLGLFTSPFMGMVDLTVIGGYITALAIASPFRLLKESAKYINTKYSERQERIAKEVEEQKRLNPELYLNIPVGLIISDIDADIKKIESAARARRDREAKQKKENDIESKRIAKIMKRNPNYNAENLDNVETSQNVKLSLTAQRRKHQIRIQEEQNKLIKADNPRSLGMTNEAFTKELNEEFKETLNDGLDETSFRRFKPQFDASIQPPPAGPGPRKKLSHQSHLPIPPPGQPPQIKRKGS